MKNITKETIEEFNNDGKLIKKTTTEWIEETEDKPNIFPWSTPLPYINPIETGVTYTKASINKLDSNTSNDVKITCNLNDGVPQAIRGIDNRKEVK
jgi:hypothetical protein